MIVQVPENQVFGSALLGGWVQHAGVETQRMAVVLKAAYDVEDNGGDPRLMVPSGAQDRVAVVFADQGAEVDVDDVPVFDVTYEADIALEKARADVVVRGYMPDAATDPVDGSVFVDAVRRLTRTAVSRSRDTARNLFGFQPRMEANREINVAEDFVPTEGDLLPPNYTSSFNNFHRQGEGFSFSTVAQLPAGGLIEIHRTTDQSDTAYSFTLPDLDLTARYRYHDGTLPDHEHCWRTTGIGAMLPDTLIIEPDDHRATILWRASWDAAAQPLDAYRRVEITQGVA